MGGKFSTLRCYEKEEGRVAREPPKAAIETTLQG